MEKFRFKLQGIKQYYNTLKLRVEKYVSVCTTWKNLTNVAIVADQNLETSALLAAVGGFVCFVACKAAPSMTDWGTPGWALSDDSLRPFRRRRAK